MTELPRGWVSMLLSDLGPWIGGGTPSKANPDYWNGPIPWVSPKDMKTKVIRNTVNGITTEAIERSSAKRVPPKSVLIVTRSGILAHSLPVAVTAVECALNQDLKALNPPRGVFPDYIAWGLRACEQRILNTCRKGGTTVHSIEMPRLYAFKLPIAPTNEQRRIVEKIEALFDEIDRGVESLRDAKRAIGLYRQSLLKAAFESRLTADWRAKNPDKLESPEALLARIRERREERHRASLDDWKRGLAEWERGGKSGKRPSKPQNARIPSMPEVEESSRLGALPDSWLRLTTESVGTVQLGRQRSPKNRSKHFPTKYIRAANITEQGLALDDLLDMDFLPHELNAYRLKKGDLLLSEASGSAAQVGKAAIWADQVPNCCFQNTVIRHQPYCRDFAVFLLWLYRYLYVSGKFAQVAGGVGINHLSASRFAQIPLPICSPAEQAEIVRILEARLEAVEALDKEVDANLARADALRQSILKSAFSGQLVPQDPTDEPASAVLARIRAERDTVPSKRSRKRAKV